MPCENIKIEIGKKYINENNVEIIHIIKSLCYILSNMVDNKNSNLVIIFDDVFNCFLIQKENYILVKKMFEMLVYLIQIDAIQNVYIKIKGDIIYNQSLLYIFNLIQFSCVLKRFTLIVDSIDHNIDTKYKYLNFTTDSTLIKSMHFHHRYVLDKKQEFLYIRSA